MSGALSDYCVLIFFPQMAFLLVCCICYSHSCTVPTIKKNIWKLNEYAATSNKNKLSNNHKIVSCDHTECRGIFGR